MAISSRIKRGDAVVRLMGRVGYPLARWDRGTSLFFGIGDWSLSLPKGRTWEFSRRIEVWTEGMDRKSPHGVVVFANHSNSTRTAYVAVPLLEWAALMEMKGEQHVA